MDSRVVSVQTYKRVVFFRVGHSSGSGGEEGGAGLTSLFDEKKPHAVMETFSF